MASIPKRVEDRLIAGIKKFQPVLALAKSKDVNESDTVVILNDLLAEVFGYAKYFEITSEFAIRGTYCDLAIKLDNKVAVLIEAKAIRAKKADESTSPTEPNPPEPPAQATATSEQTSQPPPAV